VPMNDQPLPLVSIITPSYNQGAFIQQTIESVLSQDYPYLEQIVVDGGSTDETLEILQQYTHLGERFRFVSEPDRGQSHALNKGLKMARGQIIGWLNSDDTYLPGAVRAAVDALLAHPDWAMIYGKGFHINESNEIINDYPVKPYGKKGLFQFCIICQPATFLRKHILESVGGVDENLHFCMDYDLWIRISKQYEIGHTSQNLANSRLHPSCKSVSQIVERGYPEIIQTCMKHYGALSNEWLYAFSTSHEPLDVYQFMELCKQENVFGQTPQLADMNRSADFWVPPHFRMHIECSPDRPLEMLLLKGRVPESLQSLDLLVMVNRRPIHSCSLKSGALELHIPLSVAQPTCLVEILANKRIVSAGQFRSFQVEHALPLSSEEYLVSQAYQNGSAYFLQWLQHYRHPVPSA